MAGDAPKAPRRRGRLFLFLGLGFAAALCIGAAGAWVWVQDRIHAAGPLTRSVAVIAPRGAGLNQIAGRLADAGVIHAPEDLQLYARWRGLDGALKAGEYAFEPGVSLAAVLDKMVSGDVLMRRLTIAEGLTTKQALRIIREADALSGEITEPVAEGALLPETYAFTRGDSRDRKIRVMKDAMSETLEELWPQRAEDLPIKTPEEAVILASIVEKETGLDGERGRVAAVFVNRLRRGMRLQSDPTIIYGLTDGESFDLGRRIRRSEIDADVPYNTYARAGLPPTPIANPGRAAIAAVLNPPTTDELYFVADGTGGHAFAKTLREHNANVAKWRRVQRERGLR